MSQSERGPAQRVVFRVFDGELVAVFPDEIADVAGKLRTCYAHVGQHSGCDLALMFDAERTRAATPAEYADLKAELEAIGYVLDVGDASA